MTGRFSLLNIAGEDVHETEFDLRRNVKVGDDDYYFYYEWQAVR
jgi:hypothetical protein